MTNWILDYWDEIQNGTVNVGQWVRKAYRMIVDGLATGKIGRASCRERV